MQMEWMGAPLEPMAVPGEEPSDLPRRIRAAAIARPDHVMLVDGEITFTAAELAARMDRVAAALAAQGLERGDVIATLAGVTASHVILFLGAAALGVAVAPVPVSAHPDAVDRMLRNADAAMVFGDDRAAGLDTAGLPRRDLEDFVDKARETDPLPPRVLAPELLFDIIYSSGTTGAPKGIEHDVRFRDRQVSRFARFGLDADAVALFSTPIYSNTTLATLIPALGQGARVCLMRKFDEAGFLQLAERHRVTHAMMVPVQIRRLVEFPDFGRYDLSRFQVKFSTSAPLPPAVVREVLARWPGRMINIYGMTEGGVSTVLDCSAHPDKLHTVGRPAPHAEIRIIDGEGRSLPPGEAGEVVGRSGTLMRGYRKSPETTRGIVWISPEGDAYIRSGDMGKFDEDGFLMLLDRQKDVIISGGFNIYSADIEAVLEKHPDVYEAAVIGVPSARWGETPVACVILHEGAEASGDEILNWVNARLGRIQWLTGIAVVPALPRNAIGKVLKRELRENWERLQAPAPAAAMPGQ
jgi:long-chain acyl-CoA synthetase